MQAITARKDLYEAVQTVGRAVSGRSTLPILSHILVTPQGGSNLKLTATDLEMWVECSLTARIQASLGDMEEAGGFTVPSRYFTEILGALPEADVILDRPDGGNKTQLRCGRSDYSLLGLPAEEFPALPDVEPTATITMNGAVLKAMIKQVAFAVSTDETRVILTGVLFIFNGQQIKMVATDTHRLAVRGGIASSGEGQGQAVLPARAMNEISRLAGDEDEVVIALAQGQARFEVNKKNSNGDTVATTTLITRLIEGQFPNYERVIPAGHERKLTLETAEFQKAVKRVAIVARENANRIVLETEGAQLAMSAESGTIGSARDEIEVAREGDDIQIAFNAKYLGDVLAAIETEGVVLELTEPLRPGILRPIGDNAADYLCVLMPMQVI
ncbi:DNA polymerase III subunit beta [Armatimonas rosea]|uniref:Beta sliding clamp n=1 Tax=Armatimonas rosea TaxID=685828 RepID=A0A7W9SU30_ARMRO|nr:DNA polymerase III subunit beta [Armatimonas rosea]MBB6052857.1 DNA polymerase-3 subunit beta [Armatimonas rosea]